MTRGIIYCRVSSKEQIQGTSLESQEAACREYARSKGIEVVKVFVEEGESAKFADRTQLLALVDFCQTHKGTVQVLIVWKIDRFARNVTDHYSVKATLAKYGVSIASVTEPIDTNPEGRLMETILAGFAQFDNDVRAMRTVQGMRRKLQEGIFPWHPPIGYRSSVANGEKKTQPDVPDQPTFDVLRTAWKHFATGAYTQVEMGRLMSTWGIGGKGRDTLARQSVYQLFTNPFYAGVLVDPWTGDEYEGKHTPMVTRAEFASVQIMMAARGRSEPHRKDNPEFPLRGLVRCETCERCFTGAVSRGHGGRYPYYFCCARDCASRDKNHSAANVHREFTSFLDDLSLTPQAIAKIGERVITSVERSKAELDAQRRGRRARSRELGREIEELIRMRAQNLISDDEFLANKKKLAEQKAVSDHPKDDAVTVDQAQADLDAIVEPLSNLQDTWRSLQPPFRRRFERVILPSGYIFGNIRTSTLGLLFSTFGRSETGLSYGVPSVCTPLNRIWAEIHALAEILHGGGPPVPPPKQRFEHS